MKAGAVGRDAGSGWVSSGPGHAVHFEPQVVMHTGGRVLMDDECRLAELRARTVTRATVHRKTGCPSPQAILMA
jgi:hypothetical protein